MADRWVKEFGAAQQIAERDAPPTLGIMKPALVSSWELRGALGAR